MTYAESTSVSVARSKAEIENIIRKYGADSFGTMSTPGFDQIAFSIGASRVRFDLPLPDQNDPRFVPTRNNYRKSKKERAYEAWEQECRSLWRALFLVIKAKLEAVASGITTFDSEFMAHLIVGPRGQTVHQMVMPQIEAARKSGTPGPLMLSGSKT